jgi:hypothetical protein
MVYAALAILATPETKASIWKRREARDRIPERSPAI